MIPSVHNTNPHLSIVLGDLDLNWVILKGSVVDCENLNHVKVVSEMFCATLSMSGASFVLNNMLKFM